MKHNGNGIKGDRAWDGTETGFVLCREVHCDTPEEKAHVMCY